MLTAAWPDQMTDEQWSVYKRIIDDARVAGLRFSVGGGIAFGVYTGLWRESKDIDFYVRPEDREAMKQVLFQNGLTDYYPQLPYDRGWIFRSVCASVIVDVIWSMANYRAEVDERWVAHGPRVTLRDETFRVVPVEEMIWAKLYVLQRDRTDWPDVINMIYAQRERLDWRHLLDRLASDAPILHALLIVFRWLCPDAARELPASLWKELEDRSRAAPDVEPIHRAELLDRRDWLITVAKC